MTASEAQQPAEQAPPEGGTVIIGAGPAGLSAGLALQQAGAAPLLLERSQEVGGLMRSPRWQDFILDLGRKELYARFPEIDALWEDVLGEDYGPYPHRVGSLYRGRIVELSGRYRGQGRGMPLHWLARGGLGLAAGWARGAMRPPRSYQDFWYARTGGPFARILAQGYWEKFRGQSWAAMPPPDSTPAGGSAAGGARAGGRFAAVRQALALARRGAVSQQPAWRHPRRGTGQLFEQLAERYRGLGGQIRFGAEVTGLRQLDGGGAEVTWQQQGQSRSCRAAHVVSSLPVEELWRLLSRGAPPGSLPEPPPPPGPESSRAVLLAYLFLKAPPAFPHAWLEVNDPALKCGRVTNFAAFGTDMVPAGHACFCVEYFCAGDDPFLQQDAEAQAEFALQEMAGAGLLRPADRIGALVLNLPRTNAAASWREQQSVHRSALFERIAEFKSIYHVNRPGADWASLAGLQAGRAIAADDRAYFDHVADPARRQEDNFKAKAAE